MAAIASASAVSLGAFPKVANLRRAEVRPRAAPRLLTRGPPTRVRPDRIQPKIKIHLRPRDPPA